MKQIAIFGAGGSGRRYAEEIRTEQNRTEQNRTEQNRTEQNRTEQKLVCFFDNSKSKIGTKLCGVDVLAPEKIAELPFTVVVVVVSPGFETDIIAQIKLIDPGRMVEIPDFAKSGMRNIENRIVWLKSFAKVVYDRKTPGNVAEAGVFRGDFAKEINNVFPDKTLYLFDTFEGFPAEDVARETITSNSKQGYYDFTSEQLVFEKLTHRGKAVICKGYFPQSALNVVADNERFCFVNLDLDLYQPTYAGLKFFWDKMLPGGVILIHDYFGIYFPNVKTAVHDFEKWLGEPLKMMPIGDGLSIAIVK
jgi:hypothetical protein